MKIESGISFTRLNPPTINEREVSVETLEASNEPEDGFAWSREALEKIESEPLTADNGNPEDPLTGNSGGGGG